MILKQRWDATWRTLGVAPRPAKTYEELIATYSDSDRFYHTLKHIEECFVNFDPAYQLALYPAEIEIAIWFHDAVYDTRRNDNEEKSASWADNVIQQSSLPTEVAARIRNLVLTTKHNSSPDTGDASLFVDVDLSILGASLKRFDEYEQQIRQEYIWVPKTEFRQRRAELLREFLAREHVYSTEFFQDRFETMARTNLTRSLLKLES
jgi:predicted metal-dependent HD superfamily phosphohydrolase